MKYKLISMGLIILLITITILLWSRNLKLKSEILNVKPVLITDTIFLDSPIIIKEPKNSDYVLPNTVTVNKGIVTNPSNDKKDSIVQFSINKEHISISTIGKDSLVTTNNFNIDLDRYKYTYNNNTLYKNRAIDIKFKPFIEVKYMYFNSIIDLNGGIDLKTNNITYSFGINLCYNIKSNSKVNPDLYLAIKYTF